MPSRSRRRSRPDSLGSGEAEAYDDEFGFVSDDDIAAFMAEQEYEEAAAEEKTAGFWNVQTASGMGLIGVGALYSLQQLGLPLGLNLAGLMSLLPVLAAILIMLTGFGVLSWSPAARRRKKARKRALRRRRQQQRRSEQRRSEARRAERKTVGRGSRRSSDDTVARAFEQAERAVGAAGSALGRAAEEARRRRTAARRAGRTKLLKDRKNRKLTGVAGGMANYFGLDPTVVRIAWVVATIFSQGGAIIPYLILSAVLNNDEGDDDPVVLVTDD